MRAPSRLSCSAGSASLMLETHPEHRGDAHRATACRAAGAGYTGIGQHAAGIAATTAILLTEEVDAFAIATARLCTGGACVTAATVLGIGLGVHARSRAASLAGRAAAGARAAVVVVRHGVLT